jgi:hypothetical protein
MKKLLLFILLLPLGYAAQAQGDYDNLLEMLVDEKYEKLLYRAEKYTLDDKTKKDALPYLYMSMAYHEIGKTPEKFDEDLSGKALKNSLKYCVKHRKKDKENEYYAEYEDFFDEVRMGAIAEAELNIDMLKFTKSKGMYKYMTSIDESDPGAWMMKGMSEYKLKSRKDSGLSWDKAKEIVEAGGAEVLSDVQLSLFKRAIIYCAEMWDEAGESELAKTWLELGYEYFKDDREYNVTFESIAG